MLCRGRQTHHNLGHLHPRRTMPLFALLGERGMCSFLGFPYGFRLVRPVKLKGLCVFEDLCKHIMTSLGNGHVPLLLLQWKIILTIILPFIAFCVVFFPLQLSLVCHVK